jgi:hypothetical protein
MRIAAAAAVLLLPFEGPREVLLGEPLRLTFVLLAPMLLSLLAGSLERAGERRADEVAASLEGIADLGGFLRQARDERDISGGFRGGQLAPGEAAARINAGRRELVERIERLNGHAVAAYHPVGAAPSTPPEIPADADPATRRLALAARLRALAEEVDVRIAERVNREITRAMTITRRTLVASGYRDLADSLIDPVQVSLTPRLDPSRRAVEHELSDLEAEAWRIGALSRALRRLERRTLAAHRPPLLRAYSAATRGGRFLIRLWLGKLSMNRTHPPLDERLAALD